MKEGLSAAFPSSSHTQRAPNDSQPHLEEAGRKQGLFVQPAGRAPITPPLPLAPQPPAGSPWVTKCPGWHLRTCVPRQNWH